MKESFLTAFLCNDSAKKRSPVNEVTSLRVLITESKLLISLCSNADVVVNQGKHNEFGPSQPVMMYHGRCYESIEK